MSTIHTRAAGPGNFQPPEINARKIGMIALVLLLAILIWSSVFTVEPEEVGVVLTFGKYTRESEPGLRFKLPSPIQTVVKVPVQRQLKEEFGFRTTTAGCDRASPPRASTMKRRC
jgi:membrane protease subunit HflK